MKTRSRITSGIAAMALGALASIPAHAGNNNVLILKQEGTGNEIHVDQSNADNSQIGGIQLVPSIATPDPLLSLNDATFNQIDLTLDETGALANPATQIGINNRASITLDGDGGAVFLQQGTNATQGDNVATVDVTSGPVGGSFAAIIQDGSNNTAAATINGSLSEANILQRGDSNDGTVSVGTSNLQVDNVRATLNQIGNGNDTELQVTGITAGEYSYTVIGDNTTTSVPAAIITNGASVSITQSTLTSR